MDAVSRLGLANLGDREVSEMIPVEIGEIERFNIVTSPRQATDVEVRAFTEVRVALAQGDKIEARKQRTAHEMALAFAIQQPQGLGLLFPGLRPKGQR